MNCSMVRDGVFQIVHALRNPVLGADDGQQRFAGMGQFDNPLLDIHAGLRQQDLR